MAEHRFEVHGVCYDAGVRYERSFDSHPDWRPEAVRADLRAIRHELGCDAVLLMASEPERLREAATLAVEQGLAVWLQPRPFDEPRERIGEVVSAAADLAEELRLAGADVTLVVGCELTLSAPGLLPGPTFWVRGALLPVTSVLLPRANARLRALLRELVDDARIRFQGPITYGAGDWERPDWSMFDVVGLDRYRDAHNQATFADELRRLVEREHGAGRRVIVLEFGSCTYRGAARRSSQAADVLRGRADDLRVPARLVRDEQEQARYLRELFDVFADAGVDGTFVWGFSEPALYRREEPTRDLDRASYGIVAVHPDGRREPKVGYGAVAAEYGGAAAASGASAPSAPMPVTTSASAPPPPPPRWPALARIAVMLAASIAIWLGVLAVTGAQPDVEPSVGGRLAAATLTAALAIAMVVAVRRGLDRSPMSGLAMPLTRGAWRPLLVGIAAFAIPSAIGTAIAVVVGWLSLTPAVPTLALVSGIALTVLTVLLLEAVPEELIFRGYLYRTLADGMSAVAAVLVQAVLFALFGTGLWVLMYGWGVLAERGPLFLGVGVVLGFVRMVTGSVWAAVGFHLAFQVLAQTVLGPDVTAAGPVELAAILPAFLLGTTVAAALTRDAEAGTRST